MSTAAEWGRAYAKQAKADFLSRDSLARDSSIPVSQTLHLLQMACEKLCKAHLCFAGSNPDDLQSSHGYAAKTLPAIARQKFSEQGRPKRSYSWEIAAVGQLAREIDLLAPAVRAGGSRQDNCEYPWEDHSGKLYIPAEYSFPNLNLLNAPFGRSFLKLIGSAIDDLAD